MEIGYEVPIGVENDMTGELEIQAWVVKSINQRTIQKTQKDDNICYLCGKEIPRGSCCKFANLIIVPSFDNPCPRLMSSVWWHDGCERLPIEARVEIYSKWIESKQQEGVR